MLLNQIKENFEKFKENIAYQTINRKYTYEELQVMVKQIYSFLIENNIKGRVVCYGDKQIQMIATFLACSFAGITYVPVDSNLPQKRFEHILNETQPECVFLYSENELVINYNVINKEMQEEIFKTNVKSIELEILLKPEDIYYIIYTSGSSGNPKGVQVTYENIDSFVSWFARNMEIRETKVLNQASFAFDLSVADIYFSLSTASTLYIFNKFEHLNLEKLYDELATSNVEVAIMTPSFMELLLTNKDFNQNLLKKLKAIYFCGEVLQKKTVIELRNRFYDLQIINSYGPTECTVAISFINVENISEEIIPLGYIKEDTKVYIVDDKLNELDEGKEGEILITGTSVSKGYLNCTNNKFIKYKGDRGYLTGDIGYIKEGLLYFVGRKDSQIKLGGYRIELNDITNNLYKIDYIDVATTIAKRNNNNKVINIVSLVKIKGDVKDKITPKEIKRDLNKLVPKYMCSKIKIVDNLVLNNNGKLDKIALEEIYNEK